MLKNILKFDVYFNASSLIKVKSAKSKRALSTAKGVALNSSVNKPTTPLFPITLKDLIEADAFIGTSMQRSLKNEPGTFIQGMAGASLEPFQKKKSNFYQRGFPLKSKLYAAYEDLRANSLYKKTKYNHNAAPYIVGSYNNRFILDLDATMIQLQTVFNVVRSISQANGRILFVGTRSVVNEIADPINNLLNSFAKKSKLHKRGGQRIQCVTGRWFGGTLTNSDLTRKEIPDLIFIVDPLHSSIVMNEARALGIPTAALVNSDCNPHLFTYPIIINNRSVRTIGLCAYTLYVATEV